MSDISSRMEAAQAAKRQYVDSEYGLPSGGLVGAAGLCEPPPTPNPSRTSSEFESGLLHEAHEQSKGENRMPRIRLTNHEKGQGAELAGFIGWLRRESAAIPETSDELNCLIYRYLEFCRKAKPPEWRAILDHYYRQESAE